MEDSKLNAARVVQKAGSVLSTVSYGASENRRPVLRRCHNRQPSVLLGKRTCEYGLSRLTIRKWLACRNNSVGIENLAQLWIPHANPLFIAHACSESPTQYGSPPSREIVSSLRRV